MFCLNFSTLYANDHYIYDVSYAMYIPYRNTIMKISALVFFHCMAAPLLAYRDGARENSCYDHSIDHGAGIDPYDCNPPSCSYFLRIREVVDAATLELGSETDTYECGRIYGSKEN